MSGRPATVYPVYLIGETISAISGNKLPSNKQVLQFMMYQNAFRHDLYDSAKETYNAILPFWRRAGIPVSERHNAAPKIKKFFENYKALYGMSKNKAMNQSELFKGREEAAIDSLDDLYDIAHSDLTTASEEARNFLSQQRMKGRPGTIPLIARKVMVSIPLRQAVEETPEGSSLDFGSVGPSSSNLDSTDRSSFPSHDVETQTPESSIHSTTTSAGSLSRDADDPEFEVSAYLKNKESQHDKNSVPVPPILLNRRFITQRVVGVLDRFKISDYAAMHLITAVMIGLGLDPSKFVFSKSTIYNERSKDRKAIGEDIKEKFKFKATKGSTVHWDGKLMENITTKDKNERLPVKITHEGKDQLLGAPELADGTGFSIASAVFKMLEDWNQTDNTECCCFDTTSTNTGCFQGAAVFLEQLLGRSLLYLPCRHHIAEVILRAVFELKISASSGPDVTMFKAFQRIWDSLNLDKFKSGLRDKYVKMQLKDENLELLKVWIKKQLAKPICRHDYKEFLELCLLFLGENLPNSDRRKATFRRPGPVHHARWMAKAIYSLKMFMFRDQIELSEKEKVGLADICVFIIRFYVVHWFSCPRAIEAPMQDLTLLKNVHATREKDPKLADEVIRKLINHLWYLSEESLGFSFFDKKVPIPEKRKMVERLAYDPEREPPKRIIIDMKNFDQLLESDLSDFVTCNTLKFFERFGIDTEFLSHDPATWFDREDYRDARNRIKLVKVVNDTAERGVKLMSDYNNIMSRNEEEKQWILLVVSKFRDLYKSYHKKDLILDLNEDE